MVAPAWGVVVVVVVWVGGNRTGVVKHSQQVVSQWSDRPVTQVASHIKAPAYHIKAPCSLSYSGTSLSYSSTTLLRYLLHRQPTLILPTGSTKLHKQISTLPNVI